MTLSRGPVGRAVRERRARANHVATVRPRPVERITVVLESATNTTVTTLVTPTAGKRLRIHLIKLMQLASDGDHFVELYFGTAGSILAAGTSAIDVLRIPDGLTAQTRSYDDAFDPRGPIGDRGQVLSHRFQSTGPAVAFYVVIQYSEES